MKHSGIFSYLMIFILLVLLLAVRYFEGLFYDPLIAFFKHDYLNKNLPEIHTGALLLHLLLRYTLNTLLSLGVIWYLFKEKAYLRFGVYFYTSAFLLLSALLLLFILHPALKKQVFTIFYIRRFLIQPLFLLLLIPAFYYQQKNP